MDGGVLVNGLFVDLTQNCFLFFSFLFVGQPQKQEGKKKPKGKREELRGCLQLRRKKKES